MRFICISVKSTVIIRQMSAAHYLSFKSWHRRIRQQDCHSKPDGRSNYSYKSFHLNLLPPCGFDRVKNLSPHRPFFPRQRQREEFPVAGRGHSLPPGRSAYLWANLIQKIYLRSPLFLLVSPLKLPNIRCMFAKFITGYRPLNSNRHQVDIR